MSAAHSLTEDSLHFSLDEVVRGSKSEKVASEEPMPTNRYYPFVATLRLYAGWLLAWYCLVYILGAYQHTRALPFRIPFVEALLPLYSPIVLVFTLGAFLFLWLTSVHHSLGARKAVGFLLFLVGIATLFVYTINV